MDLEAIDPTGLIREAYRIEGIGEAECRSIFIDWAIKLPAAIPFETAIGALLLGHAEGAEDHPMTRILREGLGAPPPQGRRGGRSGRTGKRGP